MFNKPNQNGFTIIELMMSTVVFSMVLLLLTNGVISFTKSYYKGITEANTQHVARMVTESITQSIQLNSANLVKANTLNDWQGFCFGNEAYVFKLHYQLVDPNTTLRDHQSTSALIKGNAPGGCLGVDAESLSKSIKNPEELLSPSMRLADFTVTPLTNGLYSLVVNVAYGDDDLLSDWQSPIPSCKSQSGSQFCAVSGLSTVVQKRIQQ